ncbi:uncharacterized protein FIBRA_05309 [Fibroporia radiculosa]|uniref:Carboxypeptidase n=1 Tax=Fibroporia radiculosa TaxID=599839 RepID=J4HXA8_9APHY|nr:uncharacterized protein FIBRA_05309 [Fibroporia radiculosa]CCM03187.1 predicted protein [Fibroporia radiculosa]
MSLRSLGYLALLASASLSSISTVHAKISSAHEQQIFQSSKIEFTSQLQTDTSIRYVTDSGVCETTPGVTQMSGYIDIGTNMSMWFWFFESRNEPETAPFTLWLNGGPGCSSMIALFQENGPCFVNPDNSSTYINPYSWNNISNMIYIDQPIGTGFSYGTRDVNSTFSAAPEIWKAFQILFESSEFKKYQNREFIFATESYGGHYGPGFVTYFDEQNAKIANGSIEGEPINVSALMINNGWFDPLIQNQAYVDFVRDAPGYGQLQDDAAIAQANASFYEPGGCQVQLQNCDKAGNSTESNPICQNAAAYCLDEVYKPAIGDRYEYDLRQKAPGYFPTMNYVTYLQSPYVMSQIGAESMYQDCSDAVEGDFNKTGDDARSLLPQLSALADSGLKILIWAGDADIKRKRIRPRHGVNVDNFTFARIYEAGHEVVRIFIGPPVCRKADDAHRAQPAFQPEASLEIFRQVINREPLHSVD